MALFESFERRIDKINGVLNSYGIASIEEAEAITKAAGLDVYNQVKGIQPICFENACWAYIVGAAIAIKKDCRSAAEAAAAMDWNMEPPQAKITSVPLLYQPAAMVCSSLEPWKDAPYSQE
jgi:hypothetical protein